MDNVIYLQKEAIEIISRNFFESGVQRTRKYKLLSRWYINRIKNIKENEGDR